MVNNVGFDSCWQASPLVVACLVLLVMPMIPERLVPLDLPLALSDMRSNIACAAAVLVIGILLLRRANRPMQTARPRRWILWTAFASGPAMAMAYFIADVMWIVPNSYIHWQDYIETAVPVGIIGISCGLIVGATIGGIDYTGFLWKQKSPKKLGSVSDNIGD